MENNLNSNLVKVKTKDFDIVFSCIGAGVVSLKYHDVPLILEEDPEVRANEKQYFGKTLGRIAGRIKSEGEIEGIKYSFKGDKNDIVLHGGELKSLSFKAWKVSLKESDKKIDVIFKINPRKGECGFFGKQTMKVIYSISKLDSKFKISFKGKAIEDTLMNYSNHIYWNLNSLDINDYYLKFASSKVAKIDENLLILGYEDVPDRLNFNKARKLKVPLDLAAKEKIGTIDNTWLFENEKLHKVLLKSKKYQVNLKTNFPAMNIYCDSSMTPVKFTNGFDFKERRAIALEPQLSNYPLKNIFFKGGEKFDYFIEYKIKGVK